MVESALTLPLSVFVVLGSLQMFLLYDARLMTEYAAYRATRAGSVSQGNCNRMVHAAIAALLPTLERTTNATELGAAFGRHRDNDTGALGGTNAKRVWIFRENPHRKFLKEPSIPDDSQPTKQGDQVGEEYGGEDWFDDPDFRPYNPDTGTNLEIRMVYWYPLRVPFANWVLTRMFLAHWGMRAYGGADPTMAFKQNADFSGRGTFPLAGGGWDGVEAQAIYESYRARTNAGLFVFPISTTHVLRMMTPAKYTNFSGALHCDAPGVVPAGL